jgi:hypothetical protein
VAQPWLATRVAPRVSLRQAAFSAAHRPAVKPLIEVRDARAMALTATDAVIDLAIVSCTRRVIEQAPFVRSRPWPAKIKSVPIDLLRVDR